MHAALFIQSFVLAVHTVYSAVLYCTLYGGVLGGTISFRALLYTAVLAACHSAVLTRLHSDHIVVQWPVL